MSLQDKFERVSHWVYFDKTRKNAPETEIRALILTSEDITEWPEGVNCDTHLPHPAKENHHMYTIRAKTEAFEKFCNRPAVLKLSL